MDQARHFSSSGWFTRLERSFGGTARGVECCRIRKGRQSAAAWRWFDHRVSSRRLRSGRRDALLRTPVATSLCVGSRCSACILSGDDCHSGRRWALFSGVELCRQPGRSCRCQGFSRAGSAGVEDGCQLHRFHGGSSSLQCEWIPIVGWVHVPNRLAKRFVAEVRQTDAGPRFGEGRGLAEVDRER